MSGDSTAPQHDGVDEDSRIGAALRRLADLDTVSTAEHPAVYEDVHHRLEDALSDASDAAGRRVEARDDLSTAPDASPGTPRPPT